MTKMIGSFVAIKEPWNHLSAASDPFWKDITPYVDCTPHTAPSRRQPPAAAVRPHHCQGVDVHVHRNPKAQPQTDQGSWWRNLMWRNLMGTIWYGFLWNCRLETGIQALNWSPCFFDSGPDRKMPPCSHVPTYSQLSKRYSWWRSGKKIDQIWKV